MQRTSFQDTACSPARSLDVAAEWWTPLIVRDIWTGRTRFDEIQENLGVSRKLLADRLGTLTREEIVVREQYQDRPARYEYVLTEKGKELMVVLQALMRKRSEDTIARLESRASATAAVLAREGNPFPALSVEFGIEPHRAMVRTCRKAERELAD